MEGNCCTVAPMVGGPAPDFKGVAYHKSFSDGGFSEVSLADYKGKWLMLFFYPLDFTFVWPTELIAVSELYSEFQSRNCEVLGVSVDSQFSHKAWDAAGDLADMKYPLLADLTKQVSADYRVLNSDGFSIRGTFLINPEGVICYQMVNTPEIGRNTSEILRVLDACQSGGLCPANWKKGDANLNP